MEYILYISRFLYRIRWWLFIGTAIITFAAYYLGKRMLGKTYNVEATLYTGAASGYDHRRRKSQSGLGDSSERDGQPNEHYQGRKHTSNGCLCDYTHVV